MILDSILKNLDPVISNTFDRALSNKEISVDQATELLDADGTDGTLINESISTAAGAQYGQLLKPMHIHSIIREAGRIPVQRSTLYTLIKVFGIETLDSESGLDKADPKEFGSYHELIKLDKFKFKNPTKT